MEMWKYAEMAWAFYLLEVRVIPKLMHTEEACRYPRGTEPPPGSDVRSCRWIRCQTRIGL